MGSVLYAITDELHQGFTAGRHPSPVDVGIDGMGIVLTLAIGGIVVGRIRASRRPPPGSV